MDPTRSLLELSRGENNAHCCKKCSRGQEKKSYKKKPVKKKEILMPAKRKSKGSMKGHTIKGGHKRPTKSGAGMTKKGCG